MAYNLTENQKGVLRWMAKEVQAGRLGEEFTVMWVLGSEGAVIPTYQGEPPVLTPGVLDALDASGLIISDVKYRTQTRTRGTPRNPRIEQRQHETSRRITLMEQAFEAVASDFRDPDSAPVTPDEFSATTVVGEPPIEIQESLQRFRNDYPNPLKVAFIMMQFGKTSAHDGSHR